MLLQLEGQPEEASKKKRFTTRRSGVRCHLLDRHAVILTHSPRGRIKQMCCR